MRRREFLASGLAASALAVAGRTGDAQAASGRQKPAVLRATEVSVAAGCAGAVDEEVFVGGAGAGAESDGDWAGGRVQVDIGPETPTVYLLLPSENLETLVGAGLQLREDAAFLAAAEPFWNAPDTSPAFERVESTLLIAFEGWPRLVTPPHDGDEGQADFSAAQL